MSSQWHQLVEFALAMVGVFGIVIILGLRYSRRRQASNLQQISSASVWPAIGTGDWQRADLLYGIWQTHLNDVVLHVRADHDTDVASITHGVSGATIRTGDASYTVVITSGWQQSARLVRTGTDAGNMADVLCTFECRGWAGNQQSRFVLADGSVLTIRSRWSLPWKSAPLSIERDGHVIGQLSGVGDSLHNDGRALVLPSSIPLPVRLFVLWRATGARVVNSVR